MDIKPVFIIMMGPPGSGKSFLIEPVIRYLNNELKTNIVDIIEAKIDDLVQGDERFIRETSELIRKRWSIENIREIQSDPTKITEAIISNNQTPITTQLEQTSKLLSEIYFNVREYYNDKNDENIRKHLDQKDNIIFETTGSNKFDWLYQKFLVGEIRSNYNVILVYPYVSRADVIKHALNRFTIQANKVLTGPNTWVRLPELRSLYMSIDDIQQNFIQLLKRCRSDKNLLDYVILYDNRPRYPEEPKIVLVNLCKQENIMECSDIINFIKTIEGDKLSYDKLKSIECMKGGYYYDYRRYKSKYLRLKYNLC
jgi:hypothetical protein